MTSSSNGTPRRLGLFGCLVIAAGARLFPLWWSPLPATLDGIVYAADARRTLTTGSIPLAGFRADALASTVLLSSGSVITDVAPLELAQLLYGLIGAATVLLGAVFARRLGQSLSWSSGRTSRAAVFAAFALAVEGIFVRRTGVPDDDALTLLAIPLLALAAHQVVRTERPAWLVVLGMFLIVLPVTHTFSTLIAAFVLLALLAGHLVSHSLSRGRLLVTGAVIGFWAYFIGYYAWAETTALTVPYLDRVRSAWGLFIAWLIVMVIGVPWLRQTTNRVRYAAAVVPLAFFFMLVAVNARISVFPGTATTPQVVLLGVVPLAVPAVLATGGARWFGRDGPAEPALLALFAGPVTVIGFSVTAGLTPEYLYTALRAQTHIHLPVLVAAAGVTAYLREGDMDIRHSVVRGVNRYGRTVAALLFIIALVATLPVAYVNLDTGSYPSTTTESEFAAGTFAVTSIPGEWTSSHTQTRIASNYYEGVTATVTPTAIWVRGGAAPSCPVISARSWTTTGAHLFPVAPATIETHQYERALYDRQRVYDAGGIDPLVVSIPRGDDNGIC